MNELENIVSSSTGKIVDNKKEFDKEEWLKQKQKDRELAYDLIDTTANDIVTDINKYRNYLDVQSRFDYSVGNILLITAQNPNATVLKDYKDWKGTIKNFKNPIIILEPSSQYKRADGSIKISYNPKKMYDISQTSSKRKFVPMNYEDKLILSAMLYESPIDLEVVDRIDNSSKYAEWNKDDNVLYIKKSDNIKDVLKDLSLEIPKAELDGTNDVELDDFKCNSVAYMISKKYNLDTTNIKLDSIPNSLRNMSTIEIRRELESIKGAMDDINNRMIQRLEKKQKNKEQAR